MKNEIIEKLKEIINNKDKLIDILKKQNSTLKQLIKTQDKEIQRLKNNLLYMPVNPVNKFYN